MLDPESSQFSSDKIDSDRKIEATRNPSKSMASIISRSGIDDDKSRVEIDQAVENEARETWQQAFKANPKALMWCVYVLFTTVMWGYDGLAGTLVLGIPQFRQDYGYIFQGQFVVSAGWQLAFSGASLVGLIFGGVATGFFSKKWGRQLSILLGYSFTIIGVLLQWLSGGSPGNLIMFTAGKLLTGIPLGIFITTAPTYCAEVSPMALRGAVTAAVNWSIVFGQFLAYIVARQTQFLPGANAYRVLFGIQWIFAALALIVLPFFPESPYHLVAQGRVEKAKSNIRRLYGREVAVERRMAEIIKDIAVDNGTKGKSSFKDCFKGTDRQRTFIATSTFVVQVMCGISWIVGYMSYFLMLGGLSTSEAFDASVVLSGLMLIGNMFGWVFIERFGRRVTGLWGAIVLTLELFMIGLMSVIHTPGAIWAQVAFMAFWALTYQATIGSVAWPIVTEVSRSSLRGHTQSLATVANGVTGAISGVALPFLMNPDQANLQGKIAFIYAGFLAFASVYIWWKWPETKGLRFAEVDELFEKGVPPRSFSTARLRSKTWEHHTEGQVERPISEKLSAILQTRCFLSRTAVASQAT